LRYRISSDAEGDSTVRFGLESTEQETGLTAGHAQALRDARARYVRAARRAKTVPGGQPGRTQDTGERVDGTEVRERQRRKASR
jgi:hypothetical protein